MLIHLSSTLSRRYPVGSAKPFLLLFLFIWTMNSWTLLALTCSLALLPHTLQTFTGIVIKPWKYKDHTKCYCNECIWKKKQLAEFDCFFLLMWRNLAAGSIYISCNKWRIQKYTGPTMLTWRSLVPEWQVHSLYSTFEWKGYI